jgi:predicted transcriptional regulator
MSPRAACRLETFGFTDVHDYTLGKAAWLAEGLPSEGTRRDDERIAAIAKKDAPTLPGDGSVGDAAKWFAGSDADVAVVLTPTRVVLGLVRREVAGLDPSMPLRDVLQPGPSTFRPSMTIREMVDYFRKGSAMHALVTTSGGEWIGLIDRADLLKDD